mgnify:CR=1 FL=1
MAAITLTGDKTQLKSLSVNASGTTHNLTTADGSGGGMISGDLAGAVDNKTYTGSKVTLKGSWDVNGDVAIQSAQTDHMDLNADATKQPSSAPVPPKPIIRPMGLLMSY